MKKVPKILVFGWMLLLAVSQLCAQAIVINAPEPADNPNLTGNSPWPAICAGSGGFNEYFVNITWAGTANAANEFVLELSDASGDFSSPVELSRVADQNTNSDFYTSFAIPQNTQGEGYKLRVRSTDPAKLGAESAAYSMYFMDVTTNINISVLGDGVPPGSVCSADPITLQVDNITNPENYQYIWYRSGTLLPSEKGHTLLATQSGMYAAYIDYGSVCTGSGNTDSNIVDVIIGDTGNNISVLPPSTTVLCSTDIETLSINTTNPNWNYQWLKDGEVITGATSTSYTVDASVTGFEGDYAVEISGNNMCNEVSDPITISNAEAYTVTIENPANVLLLPTQSQTLSVSTTANTPAFTWFRNDVELLGETASTLNVSQSGAYYAVVTQAGGACPVSSKRTETVVVEDPVSFSVAIDYEGTYTACESTTATIGIQRIEAIDAQGNAIEVTQELINAFSYQWQRAVQDLTGATNETLVLNANQDNGTYRLMATLGTYTAQSNEVNIQLASTETVAITSTETVFCAGVDTITLSTTFDLSNATFQWLLDGEVVNATNETLLANAPGTYQLVAEVGGCTITSNEIIISNLDASLITLSDGPTIILPEGTNTNVTASGADTYRWFNANNVEIESTNSVTLSEVGTYTLVATIGNCEIIRQVEVSLLETFNVPNVVTVNGDGINDQWVLPNSYANQEDVTVIIYNEQGQVMLNEPNYANNWPETTTAFKKQNMLFYYKIVSSNKVLKQGTITVIR